MGEFEDGHGGAAGDFGFFGVGEGDESVDGLGGVAEGGGLEVEGVEVFFEFEGVAGGLVGVEFFGGGVGEGDGGGEVFGELEGGEEVAHFGLGVGEEVGGRRLGGEVDGHGNSPQAG